uniref:Retinol dehydrogenase 16 n=1 Tax=Bos mutus grunniens TaxID=30521 RepID=A0A8B9WCY5_BOSMU
MWLYLVVLLGLYYLLRWYREAGGEPPRDKFVFITGCDSGFGNLLARQLDLRGLRVLAACLTEQGAEQLRNQMSDRLQTVILDITKTESIAEATEWVKEDVGDRGLWGLVNNAGILLPAAPNEWQTKDDFSKILNVNLIGLIEVTLSFPPLIRKTRGRVVNVSSPARRVSLFGGGYCISKRDLSHFGIRVVLIVPGKYKTSIFPDNMQDILEGIWSQVSPEVKESYGQKYFEDCKSFLYSPRAGMAELLTSQNLSPVASFMEHNLTAVHPRICYSIDWNSKCFTFALSYLPTPVADFILCHIL